MNNQNIFIHIQNYDIEKVKLAFKKIMPDDIFFQRAITISVQVGYLESFLFFIPYLKQRYSIDGNSFLNFCEKGNYDFIKFMLENEEIIDFEYSPEAASNAAIQIAYNCKNHDIVNLLWNYKNIKETLQKDNDELYNVLLTQDIQKKVGAF